MPQLDIVAYVGQYVWALTVLLLLFSLIVVGILPKLQEQLGLRVWAEEDLIGGEEAKELKVVSESKEGLIEIFRSLCN
uniref:ATP synthase F0 subunit 8 n=1 Tax=Tethya sp. XMU02001079 TaxID=1848167 RepID=A0A172QHA4_9METZ|nr:ATP synthase F0 subunit 8 [Tethya sp. XMU02001079]